MVDISSFNKLYNKTAQEYIVLLEEKFSELQKNKEVKNALAELHRSAHSLKSESLVMGHPQAALVAKMLEDIFDSLLNEKIQLTEELKQALSVAIHELKRIIRLIGEGKKETETQHIVVRLGQLTGIKPVKF